MGNRKAAKAAPGGGPSTPSASAAAGTRTDMVRNARGRRRRDGELRVLATRYWARGHRRGEFTWLRSLSPSDDLLRRYKTGEVDWPTFARAYATQIGEDATARTLVRGLHDIAASGQRTVVLYCHEAPGAPCHRHILREMVEDGRATAAAAERARFEDRLPTGAFTRNGYHS